MAEGITVETNEILQRLKDAGIPCEIKAIETGYTVKILDRHGRVFSQTSCPVEENCIEWIKARATKLYATELKTFKSSK